MINNNQQAFFALVRAGLWEKEVRLLPYGDIDYAEVMRLSQEQAVVGLVAATSFHRQLAQQKWFVKLSPS